MGLKLRKKASVKKVSYESIYNMTRMCDYNIISVLLRKYCNDNGH